MGYIGGAVGRLFPDEAVGFPETTGFGSATVLLLLDGRIRERMVLFGILVAGRVAICRMATDKRAGVLRDAKDL